MIEDSAHFAVIQGNFPKIASTLKNLWGTPEFNVFLEDLEQEKTGHHREGFPAEVLMALIGIGDAHEKEFPKLKPKDNWLS